MLLCLSLIFVSILTACDTDSKVLMDDSEKNPVDYLITEGGQVILPLTNFNTLNPLMTENANYHYFSKLIFEGLFEFDKSLEAQPRLALGYELIKESNSILIKLREDVFWHDGERFTSADVVFTINALKFANGDTAYNKLIKSAMGRYMISDIKKITNVKALGDFDVEITLDNDANYGLELLTLPIIPKHAFKGTSANSDYAKALEVENYIPIGTGPFEFVSYDKHKNVILRSNKSYRFGEPNIDTIVGKILEDEDLIKTAFETGQINIATTFSVDWDKYKQNSRINVVEFVSNNYVFLGFNFTKDIFSADKGIAIRKAINYGIDRQSIIQKVYLGHASEIDVPIFPDSWLIDQGSSIYGYNTDVAKDILKSGGFIDLDGDGILEDDLGNKLSFNLLTNRYNLKWTKTAQMIKENLKEIGIEINLDPENNVKDEIKDNMKLIELDRINSKLISGDYDIALLGWQISLIPDLSFMFHSNQQDFNNFIKYNNETMDSLLANAQNASSRGDKLLAYKELQDFLVLNLPYVSLFFNNKALLVDTAIIGDLNPTFFNPYNGLENCFIASKPE